MKEFRGTSAPGRRLVAGRFVGGLVAFALAALSAACVPVQSDPSDAPAPSGVDAPALRSGTAGPGDAAAVARILDEGETALRRGDAAGAREAAQRIIEGLATADGSAAALWLRARAADAEGASEEAAEDARAFLALLSPGDERRAAVADFATARASSDADAVRVLSGLDQGSLRALDGGLDRARSRVRQVATDTLLVLTEELGQGPVADLVRLEAAVGLYFRGEVARSADMARELLQGDLQPEDRRVAQALVSGTAESVLGEGVALGAILPSTGSPALREFAQEIEEGIRVALETRARDMRRPVRLELRDDGGDPARAGRALRELEQAGALGVVGPLLDVQLEAAAEARSLDMALVSPTAERVPASGAVYSLGAVDPGAAQALGRYAAQEGLRRVAVVYPRSTIGAAEAQAFREAFQGASAMAVESREFTYEPGVTFFREQLMGAVDFGAEAVVLPVPESDVELIAPQVSFFALDSLGVQILGTGAWASPEVLERVDQRHLDGVVVASAREPDGDSEAYLRFVDQYEAVIRKTLRSPVPAFGYDATSLLLEAIDRGARSPADLEAELATIREFPGATGTLSVESGQIVRSHRLYEIRQGRLLHLGRRLN